MKRILALGLMVAFILSLAPAVSQAEPQKKKDKEKQPQKGQVYIPKEVKAIIEEGLPTRQGRQDLPFSLFKYYVLPAQVNFHTVFLFKAKNADMGYIAPAAPPAAPGAPPPAQAQPPQPPAQPQTATPAAAPAKLVSRIHVFLEFRQVQNGTPGQVVKEVYVPATLEEDAAGYDPEKVQWYSTGYPMPAGNYLLSMALASPDLKKVGVSYLEFSLPDPATFQSHIDTTSIFVIQKMEQMAAAETRTDVHKNYFTYSILQIVPNVDLAIAPGETIEVFYFVFGARPNDQQKNDIEAAYEVKKGEETVLRWEAQKYDYALISQPLPMKQTVKITDDKGERTETRDLAAGPYSLIIKVKDVVSGNTCEKKLDFEVK